MVANRELSHEPAELDVNDEPLIMVIYGEFGRGKTTLAELFPKPFFLDTNRGMLTLGLKGKKPMRFEPEGYKDLEALYFVLKDLIEEGDYETLVVDNLDSLVFLLMDEMTEDAVSTKEAQGKTVSIRMQFVPEQGDFYGNQRQMQRFLVALRRLGVHIIILSGQRTTNGQTGPNVSPGMDKVVCDFASVIGEMLIVDQVDEEDEALGAYEGCRVLFTDECNSRSTKSRIESLKPFVVIPKENGFDTIWERVQAEYAAATQKQVATKPRRRPAPKKAEK